MRWKLVEQADFLLKLPKLRHNLIGRSCEHIANMCARSGLDGELSGPEHLCGARCHELRAADLYCRPVAGEAAAFWLGGSVALAGIVFSVGVKEAYDDQIRRFWLEIREDWLAHERMLDQDPRNGVAG